MAVEKSLENPLCRGVQGGSNHWPMTLVQHKLATEQRRAIEVVVRRNGRGRPLEHRPQRIPWWPRLKRFNTTSDSCLRESECLDKLHVTR